MGRIVADLSPGVDALAELTKAIAASVADPTHPEVEIPGTPDVAWEVSDTLFVDPLVALVGHGAWIRRADAWASPKPGQGHHLAVWQNSTATAVVVDVGFDGNGAGQNADFVGDTIRVQKVTAIDFEGARTKNMRGLTTLSTPQLAETFAIQSLRVPKARLVRCDSWNDDGAPTATGIVFHWCDDWSITDTLVENFMGQGFGCFGGKGKGSIDGCQSIDTNHAFNLEAGTEGPGQTVIIINSSARNCPIAVCVNGNSDDALGLVTVTGLLAVNCGTQLLLTGEPSPVSMTDFVAMTPTVNIVHVADGDPIARSKQVVLSGTVAGAPNVPTLVGPRGHERTTPETWAVTYS